MQVNKLRAADIFGNEEYVEEDDEEDM